MALPSTGNQISFNQIRIEILVPLQTGFSIGNAASGVYNALQNCQSPFPTPTDPDQISEWWSYDHSKSGSFWADGKTADSCFNVCNAVPGCNKTVYAYNSTYYDGTDRCTAGNLMNTFFASPTACSGGTFSGQTCYQFSAGAIVYQETCTLCVANYQPCPQDPSDCCSGGCCNGYCDPSPC